jgi:hypothetical protein
MLRHISISQNEQKSKQGNNMEEIFKVIEKEGQQ